MAEVMREEGVLRAVMGLQNTPGFPVLLEALRARRDEVRSDWEQSDDSLGPVLRGRACELSDLIDVFENATLIAHKKFSR